MAKRATAIAAGPRTIRCAVYTRKSTEEGLEQEYNSLDAQFDACAAYIASQRHEGWTMVRERYDDGGFSGGIPFTRGMLFHLLKNRIYLGMTVHQDIAYPGEHPAIVDEALFASVQQQIEGGTVGRTVTRNTASPSLLVGLLRDGLNRRMTPTHASKAGKRCRYYVTAPDELRTGEPPAWRLPARDIETIVGEQLKQLLTDRNAIPQPNARLPHVQLALRGYA